MSHGKTADSVELEFGTWIHGGPRNCILDRVMDPPHGKGTFGGFCHHSANAPGRRSQSHMLLKWLCDIIWEDQVFNEYFTTFPSGFVNYAVWKRCFVTFSFGKIMSHLQRTIELNKKINCSSTLINK